MSAHVERPAVSGWERLFGKIRDWRSSLLHFRWRVAQTITPRRIVHSRGLCFTLQCNNWITYYRWQSYNTKEPETLDWIDAWMRDGDVFFDIGANIGVYTVYAALRHPRAHVIAFEPEYANLHLLRDNIIENGLQDRAEIYSMALSNRSGVSHLHLQDFTPGAALHTESRDTLNVTRAQHPVVWREGIFTLTLDRFCDETGLQPNCLKVDVDGTEPEVLEGGIQTLSSPRLRSIIIELPDGKQARDMCERIMYAAGLHRGWQAPLAESPNEIWVRDRAK